MAGLGNSFDDDDIISAINVTPLVDVALVLLIIFLATSYIIVRAAIPVDLPRSSTAEEILPDHVSVLLDAEGRLFLNGEPTDEATLRSALEAAVEANPNVRALIAADRGLDYGAVVDLIDLVREAKVSGFSLNLQREYGERE